MMLEHNGQFVNNFFNLKQDGRRPFELVYRGQFDDSRPSNGVPVTGRLVLYIRGDSIDF